MTRLTRRGSLFLPCLLPFCPWEGPKGVLGGGLVSRELHYPCCISSVTTLPLEISASHSAHPLKGGEAPSERSLESGGGREKIEAGRKGWLQQGLEHGANLEAFAPFFSLRVFVCFSTYVDTFHLSVHEQHFLISTFPA